MIETGAVHRHQVRVYYEDTDLAGIVYYANYLRFIERARTEMLRDYGVDQNAVRAETGVVFAVRRCEIDYLRPATFDDLLTVLTTVDRLGGASLDLTQIIERDGERLISSRVRIACIGADGRPARMPPQLGGG